MTGRPPLDFNQKIRECCRLLKGLDHIALTLMSTKTRSLKEVAFEALMVTRAAGDA